MIRVIHVAVLLFAAVAGLMSLSAFAQTPDEVLAAFGNDVQANTPSFQGFSPARGEQFFKQKHSHDLSCSSCHTDNPASSGKHTETGKAIKPMAPAANADRFTDLKKVEKWFKRNCNDVLAYLLAIKN